MYEKSDFSEKIEKISQIIENKLTNLRRVQRFSCNQLLEVMKDCTIEREVIKNDYRFEYFLMKFQDNKFQYFKDILNY